MIKRYELFVEKINLSCTDCGGKTEAYFVEDDIWTDNVPKSKQKKSLCLSCLEKRVGRKLTKKDFKKSEIHGHQEWWKDVNESLRDKMIPKSDEDIKNSIGKLTPKEKL